MSAVACRMALTAACLVFWCGLRILEAGEDAVDAQLEARKLAALRDFRGRMARQSFVVDEARLMRLIETELDGRSLQGPHPFVSREELRSALDREFDAAFNATLQSAARAQDPNGHYHLVELMQKDLGPGSQQHKDARARYDRFEKDGLSELLERSQVKLASEQRATLSAQLTASYLSQHLKPDDIERAQASRKPDELATAIFTGILKQQSESFQRRLLDRARDEFRNECRSVVLDGVQQLNEQLQALQAEPKSHTPTGMRRELQERLKTVEQKQAQAAQSSSGLRKSYGIFPSVNRQLEVAVNDWFDRRVAQAIDAQLRTAAVPKEHRMQIESAIRADLAAHHEIAGSQRLLDELFRKLASTYRESATNQLATTAAAGRSSFDDVSPAGLASFKSAVDERLQTAGSAAQNAWNRARDALVTKYKDSVLSEVRKDMARAEANQKCPQLSRWIPDETAIVQGHALPLTPADLQKLNVWGGSAPTTTQALRETWAIWSEQAGQALAAGTAAYQGQAGLVSRVKSQISPLVAKGRERGRDYWIAEFTRTVEADWRKASTAAVRNYPGLFEHTHELIKAAVDELLKVRSPEPGLDRETAATEPAATTSSPELPPPPVSRPSPSTVSSQSTTESAVAMSYRELSGAGSGRTVSDNAGAATGARTGGGMNLGDGAGQKSDGGGGDGDGGGGGGDGQGGGGNGGALGGAATELCPCCGHKPHSTAQAGFPWWLLVLLIVTNIVTASKWYADRNMHPSRNQ